MSSYRKSKLFIPPDWNGILVVGDCPYSESSIEFPFMQSHFSALLGLQKKAGWNSGRPALANILSTYPKNGYFTACNEEVLKEEVKDFNSIVAEIKPRLVFGLGRQTSTYVKPGCTDLDDERGAPFMLGESLRLLSYHPREIFRKYENNIIAESDFIKAWRLLTEGWKEPVYNINYQPSFKDVCEKLYKFLETKCPLGVDIETNYHLKITCICLAYNTTSAIVIPFVTPMGHYWNQQEEKVVWKLLAQVLEKNPLVGQHAVHFDHYILAMNKILANFVGDTEFAHWEVYCEMSKSLAFINSLYLMNPYWKSVLKEARSGRVPYQKEWEYCGKDGIVTLQAASEIKKELLELPPSCFEHYRFNIRVSRAFQYMSLRGVRFDKAKRDARLKDLEQQEKEWQSELNKLAGKEIMVTSPKRMKTWLYEELKLPVRYKEVRDDEGDVEMRETQDYLTILYLARQFPNLPQVLLAGKLRKLKKRISSLSAIQCRPGTDIISWTFNVVGTETGRASGYKPPDGCGVQPQNPDSRDRDIYCAGDNARWCKADLEGADSWTVAAMLVACGDSRMMDDLLHHVKPAQILGIAKLYGSHLMNADVETIKSYMPQFKAQVKLEEKQRGKKRTIYDATKAVSHGSNYCMGPKTTHENIFKKSDGDLFVPIEECKQMQMLYEKRYKGLFELRNRMVGILNNQGYLDAFSGNRRYFFGRRDNSTVREMMSQLPQAHTTYATNLLLERFMFWKGNRVADGSRHLIHQPVNQVHDETNTIFTLEHIERARDIFRVCSTNRITCWGVDFTIPFEVSTGLNWGECDEDFL